ncbi:hypothetical protein LOAG_02055 [Loa loa]|uniref:Uncharacterized protein n=1 Tax=Loa loa TaxID=7209 RepID=A0A1S0U7H7_LOALO|nr:hypothetical protein LOAG_02055 [Loa loa]EFO26425.1 hypothetical protein LOAG_02055 [Loa loa]
MTTEINTNETPEINTNATPLKKFNVGILGFNSSNFPNSISHQYITINNHILDKYISSTKVAISIQSALMHGSFEHLKNATFGFDFDTAKKTHWHENIQQNY